MNDEDHYAAFGSSLPAISEDEPIRKKPLRIEEQIATDDNGRRRFHGAFTGGFSAGFFNTVGSRDGWAPKSFKSSRSQPKKDYHNQTPNDFMNDDDRGGFGFAPQGLKTNEVFESRKRDSSHLKDSLIPGDPVFEQIFVPVKDTIGVQLLKRMGWKEGKGIGPKLRKSKKKVIQKAIQSVQPQNSTSSRYSDEEEEEDALMTKYKDFLFSPDDVPQSLAQPKVNSFGIGYKGLIGASDSLFGPMSMTSTAVKFKTKTGTLGSIKGQAFGVGAYEEEDEDIYGDINMSQYDFSLSLENDSPEKVQRSKKSRWEADPNEDVVIEGFERAKNKSFVLSRTVYKPPSLPKGFKPNIFKKSRFEPEKKASITNPTPIDRQSILSTPKIAVEEEKLSEKDVSEINSLIESNSSTKSHGEFCPFPDDPLKQKRYEKYLICVKHNRRTLGLQVIHSSTSMSQMEKEKEKLEFLRAESLFKPLVSVMAAKFVSANQGDANNEMSLNVSSQLEHAVSAKMYGQLTREKTVWHPAPLICARFNVKNPYLDKEIKKPQSGKNNLLSRVVEMAEARPVELETKDSTTRADVGVQNPLVSTVVEEKEEILKEKPPIDLFKSIFLDSSDSSGDEDEKKEEVNPPVLKDNSNSKRKLNSSKVPTGVFAGIDLDFLLTGPSAPVSPQVKPEPKKEPPPLVEEREEMDHSYGPQKPSEVNLTDSYSKAISDDVLDLSDWDEKNKEDHVHKRRKSKKSKSSKKKKKLSKKSSKAKKKKKRKHYSSSSSSSDS